MKPGTGGEGGGEEVGGGGGDSVGVLKVQLRQQGLVAGGRPTATATDPRGRRRFESDTVQQLPYTPAYNKLEGIRTRVRG